ncbi:MAG: TasA family protein [Cellulomonas sp.]
MDDLLQEMIQPAGPTSHDRARRRRLVMSAATVGLAVIGVTSLTTSALFTDNDSATSGTFTTGSVDISRGPDQAVINATNMAPGDITWGPITVNNSGSLGFRYAIAYNFTDTVTVPRTPVVDAAPSLLSTQLSLTVNLVADAASCTSEGPKGTTSVLATIPAGQAVTAETVIIGLRTTGVSKPAGTERPLDSGKSEVLCVGVGMDLLADNSFQKTAADLTLTFYAEQTANNPLRPTA